MTKYGENAVSETHLHSNKPGIFIFQSKKLTGAVLSISENLRVKGQGHHMSEYGQNLKFKSYQL